MVFLDNTARRPTQSEVHSGWATSINAELGNLGTDKSVPYKYLATSVRSENVQIKHGFNGFSRIYTDYADFVRVNY